MLIGIIAKPIQFEKAEKEAEEVEEKEDKEHSTLMIHLRQI